MIIFLEKTHAFTTESILKGVLKNEKNDRHLPPICKRYY